MKHFSKKDLYFSLATGFYTGLIVWKIFEFLGLNIFNVSSAWMMLLVPVLWILGVNLGYFLGRWMDFFNQFGKFAAIGFTNAAVYFGIIDTLIYFSGFNKGLWYSVFVAIAFTIGTVHSYFWNKYWAFSAGDSRISWKELSKFFAAYIIAGVVNIGIASGMVNFLNPMFGLTNDQWANVGGVAGSAVALIVSFIGVKLGVFKNK